MSANAMSLVERIGAATLYLGDCREVLPTLGKVDAVVTDPPYGVELTQRCGAYRNSRGHRQPARYLSYDDTLANWRLSVRPAIEVAISSARSSGVFCAAYNVTEMPSGFLGGFFTPAGTGLSSWGFNCLMPVMFYGKCPYLANGMGSRPSGRYGVYGNDSNGIDHPCPKPIRVTEWLVDRVSLPGEVVLDIYMGSGTTGVACANLGREFIGIEIEPRYFDTACRRIETAQRQGRLFDERPPKASQACLGLS